MTRYRIQYDSLKPGGHAEAEDVSLRNATKAEVDTYIIEHALDSKYCTVTEFETDDSEGQDVTAVFGWYGPKGVYRRETPNEEGQ